MYPRRKRVEDYLEVIYIMICNGEKPRIREIARRLNVKPSSVVEYLRRLHEEGYLIYEKGENITLTEKGLRLAKETYRKHQIITQFLIQLGVSKEIAEIDACYIEHGLHPETLEKIIEFLKNCEKAKTL